jgi:hypothetical protein
LGDPLSDIALLSVGLFLSFSPSLTQIHVTHVALARPSPHLLLSGYTRFSETRGCKACVDGPARLLGGSNGGLTGTDARDARGGCGPRGRQAMPGFVRDRIQPTSSRGTGLRRPTCPGLRVTSPTTTAPEPRFDRQRRSGRRATCRLHQSAEDFQPPAPHEQPDCSAMTDAQRQEALCLRPMNMGRTIRR